MQPFSSRVRSFQLLEKLTHLVRSKVDRLIYRVAYRRKASPSSPAAQDVQIELEQRLKRMQQALDEQALLLRIVVHDLRMPLTSIQGYTDLLRQGVYGTVSDEQLTVLNTLAYSILYLENMVSSLLDTVSAETHTLRLAREPFDPGQLAQATLADCYPQAVRQGLTLQFHSAGQLPMLVGDSLRVRQMLFNLLGNALRYTKEGGITLSVVARNQMVEFRVQDTGTGIPEDMQALIWKPFVRLSNSENGLGIGLYTVQQLALAMGGSAGVQSTPGKGSVFWIRLPYQEREQVVGDNGLRSNGRKKE
jgi:signal transduction histidine kinase